MRISESFAQVWPAFVLVMGLLLIGLVAHRDGLFEQSGQVLQRLPGPTVVLLAASFLLVAVVTAVLNLDTAAVFLTPVLIHAARGRGVDEEPFLYGTVFMANASSLYLPGSNLTNLLVLGSHPVSGQTFAARMLPLALAATLSTALGLFVLFARRLRSPARAPSTVRRPWTLGLGLPATLAAAILMLALSSPAIPVLVVGGACAGAALVQKRLGWRDVMRALGPFVLVGLFVASVALDPMSVSPGG